MRKIAMCAALILAAGQGMPAFATEGGGGAYPNGAESIGVAQLPPPGTYLLGYSTYYSADRLNDGAGDRIPIDFKVDAFANIARVVHITDKKLLGATVGMQAFVPIVDLSVRAGGAKQDKFGIGDLIVNPLVLGWNDGNLNVVATVDTYVPTGRYRRTDLANIGRNYWTFEPVLAMTYADPKGGPEFSAKLMYDFNTRNKATDYRSGQEFHADFAAAYNFNPLTVGVTGYYYKQTTDDRQADARVGPDGNRGEAFALGPVVRYQLGKVPITAQWQHEFHAENRPQGDKFWLKAAFRF